LAGSSAVVLILLAVTWNTAATGSDVATLWMQSGLAGMGFFAVTLLAGEMSSRLASQAMAARSGLELARQQAQLNRLVLEEMTDGVLVVDRRLRVRAANPAGRRLLVRDGLGRPAPFQLSSDTAWADIEATIGQAFVKKSWPTGGVNVTLKFSDGMTRTLRMRARFTRRRSALSRDETIDGPAEIFCVVFVEDLRAVHDRTRQEKLAAMGRVSAGIAHEIRNPLAAIAQANALLSEEVQGREHQMLTRMVNENVERLKLIVDDVMAVAPGHDTTLQTMDANVEVGRIVAEWSRSASLPIGPETRLRVELPTDPLPVIFDAEHLRRVLVNLLDNARRYATDSPGAMTLHLAPPAGGSVMLSVASDGEPIPADIEPYLFEPFFSTRSRGTGLGLYICRELCERHGASIDYWQHPSGSRHVNEFRVVFRVAEHTDFSESRLLS
jgi:two-component system, NtrC family, sensor histidine kinase PilS